MPDLTVPGVPASIPRTTYLDMIRQLGIDPEQLRELRWGWDTITAVMFALDENGNQYADGDSAAVHEICIRIDDGASSLPREAGTDWLYSVEERKA